MTPRDTARLAGVHPDLVAAITDIFAELALSGDDLFIVQGVRTVAQQQALYAEGRTLPGRIVTYKDGILHPSNHQPHADGFGYAVDCAFTGGDPFADSHPWDRYGTAVEKRGLRWGGHFIGLEDRPHAELPPLVTA